MHPILRDISRILGAQHERDGTGLIVRRALPTRGLSAFDPFLRVDELGPVEVEPAAVLDAARQYHRAKEVVTYLLDGELEYQDSGGRGGVLAAGSVQCLTAGSGVERVEYPLRRLDAEGTQLHGFHIWIRSPETIAHARYQEASGNGIPEAVFHDGRARARVIAGSLVLCQPAPIATHTSLVLQDWSIGAGADVTVPLGREYRALAYVFREAVWFGGQRLSVREGQLAVLGPGDAVRLRGPARALQPARMLLLGGVPMRDP